MDPQKASGVFTFSGTGTNFYAVKLGLTKVYPDHMLNGLRSNDVVVVGNNAPPKDVVLSTNILSATQRYLIEKLQRNVTVGEGILANEAKLVMKDYIVLGNPCDNEIAAELFKNEISSEEECQIFKPGESIIKLIPTSSNTVALYIGGYSSTETEVAAQVLILQANNDNNRYDLNGKEFHIQGTKADPQIVAVVP